MDHGSALNLRDTLAQVFSDRGLESYPKVVHLVATNSYTVRVVLHPEESRLQQEYSNLEFSPWTSVNSLEYSSQTPTTPSSSTDQLGYYPSMTRRNVDGPSVSPDVNPAYPGLRRIPELQDLVRRVAMPKNIQERLARVEYTLGSLDRLSRLAVLKKPSLRLCDDLLEQLNEDGFTSRHKITKLTKYLIAAIEKAR